MGTIICEDLFAFAKEHRATFNFVYSMGLIEHFGTPHAILEEMYNLLKPGGTMLTIIPNLRGMYTPIARVASPKLLATHKVILPIGLATAFAGSRISRYRIWIHRRSFETERR